MVVLGLTAFSKIIERRNSDGCSHDLHTTPYTQ
jgi:hypothetical protein